MKTQRTTCRACNGFLREWLSLPAIYPSTFINSLDIYNKIEVVPLTLVKCDECNLVQSEWTVSPDSMYIQYWYESGLNKSMRESLENVVNGALSRVSLEEGDAVLDVGCNDGTLFSFYPKTVKTIGFDPAKNLGDKARSNCSLFVNDFYPSSSVAPEPCKIVTTIAMFYDLEHPAAFVAEIKKWLHRDGIWIIQLADLRSMMDHNAYDNIVHEHLEHWSLLSLVLFLKKMDIDVFDVEYNTVNGGSLRAFCCHSGARKIEQSVHTTLESEKERIGDHVLEYFVSNMQTSIDKIRAIVNLMSGVGENVAALGASTKGNTFLQLCGFNPDHISRIGEVNVAKHGLLTVGSNIPICDEQSILDDESVKYALILPWHFMDTFVSKCKRFLERGGVFLAAMPHPSAIFIDKSKNVLTKVLL